MKKFWVDARPWNKGTVTSALEAGAEAVVVPAGFSEKVKKLGLIATISEDGDMKLGTDVVEIRIENKEDEEKAAHAGASKLVIVETSDWTVIPLENLVAQSDGVIAVVTNADEARTAVKILEKGVAGVLLKSSDPGEIKKTGAVLRAETEKIQLTEVETLSVKSVGMGDRVCVDTCTNMTKGQGMLIGNSGGAMFLIHAESIDNPYVAARPFRVNAGAVHAYIRVPGGKTKYLSEICAGNEVMIVKFDGTTEPAVVGRAKVEKRPLMLLEAAVPADKSNGIPAKTISIILQNAETIRLVKPDGSPISIVELKPGDKILAHISGEARHFGMKITESIMEK